MRLKRVRRRTTNRPSVIAIPLALRSDAIAALSPLTPNMFGLRMPLPYTNRPFANFPPVEPHLYATVFFLSRADSGRGRNMTSSDCAIMLVSARDMASVVGIGCYRKIPGLLSCGCVVMDASRYLRCACRWSYSVSCEREVLSQHHREGYHTRDLLKARIWTMLVCSGPGFKRWPPSLMPKRGSFGCWCL